MLRSRPFRLSLVFTVLALFLLTKNLTAQNPLPASKGSPQVGQKAPDFTLPETAGKPVKLSELLAAPAAPGANNSWLLLIFYRGYW